MTRRMRVNTDQILCLVWRWGVGSAAVRPISVIRGSPLVFGRRVPAAESWPAHPHHLKAAKPFSLD